MWNGIILCWIDTNKQTNKHKHTLRAFISCVYFNSSFWAQSHTHTLTQYTSTYTWIRIQTQETFRINLFSVELLFHHLSLVVCKSVWVSVCVCVRESALKALAASWDIKRIQHNTEHNTIYKTKKIAFNSYAPSFCGGFFHPFCASARVHKVYSTCIVFMSLYYHCTAHSISSDVLSNLVFTLSPTLFLCSMYAKNTSEIKRKWMEMKKRIVKSNGKRKENSGGDDGGISGAATTTVSRWQKL